MTVLSCSADSFNVKVTFILDLQIARGMCTSLRDI
jgi:2-C-methyl-D-erythritol 4-phosphate cytidylyltransferase